MFTIVIIAKECLPGKVKTRLHPDVTYQQAAELATASLTDTISLVQKLPTTRRILAWQGNPKAVPKEATGFEILPQVEGTLDHKLAAIFNTIKEPLLLIGMDTPQLTLQYFDQIYGAPESPKEAWIGLAEDGGFWALAMTKPNGDLIKGVPMSQTSTGQNQLQRLQEARLTIGFLPKVNDIDTIEDARQVAVLAPQTRFAQTYNNIKATIKQKELIS